MQTTNFSKDVVVHTKVYSVLAVDFVELVIRVNNLAPK